MTEKRKNLLFIAVILALAAVLWLAAHHGGTGRTAVLRYGTPQTEQRTPSVRPVSVQVAGLPATVSSV